MFAALLVQLPALVGFTMNFLIQIGAGVMWRLIKKISFLLHLLHWCAKKNTLAEFCCSVTAKQEKTQMSQQQLGGFTSRWCNSFLCFTSFVRPHRRTGASCSLAFWERPYTEERIPPAHVITQYITSLRMPPSCVCIRVCVSMLSGAIGISRKWQNWWSGTTQRRREIAGLNQQTVTVCAYVCEWE